MLRPESPPAVDREALAEKERRDRAKLEEIVRFCYAQECRQEFILRYFGQEDAASCGNCDRCHEQGAGERRPGRADEVLALRKALSGVARMSEPMAGGGWRPRFGKGKIVQMLVGSRSQEVLGARLDELSTYGILKDFGTSYVYDLIREAERAGLLRTEKPGDYPLLGLTASGAGVMREPDPDVSLCWPSTAEIKGGAGAADGALEELSFDDGLFRKLKEKRREMAAAEGGVPPYVIFSNQTLEFMARLKPESIDAGRRIRGVGEIKAERYLPEFIGVIRDHLGDAA